MSFKKCSACKQEIELSLYSINRASKDGLQHRCKPCDNEYQRKRKEKNKEKLSEYGKNYQRKRREDFHYCLKCLLYAAKKRAKTKNIPFSITLEDIVAIYPKDSLCPVLGIPLNFNKGISRNSSPSIDQIEPSKGYTKDNIQILSWRANMLKSNASLEEVEKLLVFLRKAVK